MPLLNKKILLTGATGFVGGSMSSQLLDSPESAIKNAQVSCLLRGADRVARLSSAYGDRIKEGITFSSHGDHSRIRGAKLVAIAGHELGLLPDTTVEHLSPEVGAHIIESVLAFNAQTMPNAATSLGWKPLKGEGAWEQGDKDDLKRVAQDLGLL